MLLSFWGITHAQIQIQPIYTSQSCSGNIVRKTIVVSDMGFENIKFYYKGSNVKGFQAFIDGVPLDTIKQIKISDLDPVFIDIEFEISDRLKCPVLKYMIEREGVNYRSSTPINLATFNVNNKQKYIQTHDSCSEYVYWAFSFYATQTDIYLYDITGGKRELIKNQTFYCCSHGNLIRMPRDTKGKFAVSVSGCFTSDYFTFEVNTLYKE